MKYLDQLEPGTLSSKDEAFRACTLTRLAGQVPQVNDASAPRSDDPFIAAVLSLYRHYWQTAVAVPGDRERAENVLRASLATVLRRPDLKTMTEVENELEKRLSALNMHGLFGKTGLLRDAMIWQTQEDRVEHVALPGGMNDTRVFYLNDFLSAGWSRYLTCGRTGTGGFAKPEGLYVITFTYPSLSDETFKVSFLGHESQHYSDYQRFPDLKPWELEYRAKLVELIYAETTRQKLLNAFIDNQSDNPDDSHSYADRRLLTKLRSRLHLETNEQLMTVPGTALQEAASEELQADSETRKSAAK